MTNQTGKEVKRYGLTQKRLKEILDYDPETGIFTYAKNHGRMKKGDRAGNINSHGYVNIKVLDRLWKAHRLAFFYMEGDTPGAVDHINHVRTDNRWINLRPADRAINGKNQRMGSNNKSGVTGVFWHKSAKKWVAQIRVNRKRVHLGSFASFDDAVAARKEAEVEHGFHPNHGKPQEHLEGGE